MERPEAEQARAMRILFVTRNTRLGGGVTYLQNLLPALQERGHHCELMTRGGLGLAGLQRIVGKTWWLSPIAVQAAAQTRKIIRHKSIDVVNTLTRRCAQHAMPACRQTQTPLVMSVLNCTSLDRYLSAADYAQAIVALSEQGRDYFAGNYPQFADKLRASRVLLDRSVFRPCAREDRTAVKITYMGRLSRTKGEHALVLLETVGQLLGAIPNLEVTVVGAGSRLRRARRRAAQINKEAQRPVVQVVGATLHPEQFYQQADIVVGAAYTALGALACHCTVVGLGFAGLFGAVTPDNIDEAIAASFGDTSAHWSQVDSSSLADQILHAYRQPPTDYQWVEIILDEQFAAAKVAAGLEEIFQQAIRST